MAKQKQKEKTFDITRTLAVYVPQLIDFLATLDALRGQLVDMIQVRGHALEGRVSDKLQEQLQKLQKLLQLIKSQLSSPNPDKEKIFDHWTNVELCMHVALGCCDLLSHHLEQNDGMHVRPFVGSLTTMLEKALGNFMFNAIVPAFAPREINGNFKGIEPLDTRPLVLIVEDNIPSRDLLEIYLEQAPVKILSTADGIEAYALANRLALDLVLLDLVLPGLDGYEILKLLKVEEERHELPIIMISAVGEFDKIIKCIEMGAEEFLSKPFNPTLLHARVNACLEKKALRDRHKKYIQEISQHRDLLQTTIDYVNNGILVFDAQGDVLMCNTRFAEMYKLENKSIIENKPYRKWLEELMDQHFFKVAPQGRKKWIEERGMAHQSMRPSWSFTEHLEDGRWFEITEKKMPNGGIVSVHKDITGEKLGKDRLTYIAYHDPLTGLANRRFLTDIVAPAFDAAPNNFQGVLYLDLDGFKGINDKFGHDVGDKFLSEISARIQNALRQEDEPVRLGGDEFCAVVKSANDMNELEIIASRLLEKVSMPYTHEGKNVEFSASIGIACSPDNGTNLEAVLQAADQAMFEAKQKGKGIFCVAQCKEKA